MRTKFLLILCAISCCFQRPAHGQFGLEQFVVNQTFFNRIEDRQFDLNFRRAGADALGMGGAFLASSSPGSALWNPAALAQVSRPSLAVNGAFNLNTQAVNSHRLSGLKVIPEIAPKILPTFAGASVPFALLGKRASVGFAYQRLNPITPELTQTFYFYPAGTTDEVENPQGTIYALAPSLAFEPFPWLSVGASFQSIHGSTEYQFEGRSTFIEDIVYYWLRDEESYEASRALLGALIKPASWLSLAATVTPAWSYKIKEERESQFFVENFVGTTAFGDTIVTPDEELSRFEIVVPMFYAFGLALQPHAKLRLAFDFEARPWSQADIKADGVLQSTRLSDSNSYRLGLEYMSSTKWAEFPLRLGYYLDPSPYKDRYFRGTSYGEQVKGGVFTFGMGFVKKSVEMHLAIERGTKETEWWLDSGAYYNDRISSTKDTFNEITITAYYRL